MGNTSQTSTFPPVQDIGLFLLGEPAEAWTPEEWPYLAEMMSKLGPHG